MEVNTTTTTDPINMYGYLNNLVLNPVIFIIIFLIIIGYFFIFSSLGNNVEISTTNSGNYQQIFGIIVVVILVILILINAFQYFFSISITAYLKDIFTNKPEVDVIVDQSIYEAPPVPEIRFNKQVFNIPGNYYTYDNAKALCTAYGSNLATYKQLEDAYKDGGEWCNYGWSDGQMILFPTQQNPFNNLQKIKGHEHDCGRPGINGGYIANPNLKFGVNCYGNKPKITQDEEELMKTTTPYPQTYQDIIFQKKVDFWKNHVDQILVSPFNYDRWAQI
jgi:hypothetical protein